MPRPSRRRLTAHRSRSSCARSVSPAAIRDACSRSTCQIARAASEDDDVQPGQSWRPQDGAKHRERFLPRETAGVVMVDCGHEGVVEHVDVEVDPEPFDLRLLQLRDHSLSALRMPSSWS
jgi:hypothetical protein